MSEINSYVNHGVIIGPTDYPSPLTITASGTVVSSNNGVYAAVANPTLANAGTVVGTNRGGTIEAEVSGAVEGKAGFGASPLAGSVLALEPGVRGLPEARFGG